MFRVFQIFQQAPFSIRAFALYVVAAQVWVLGTLVLLVSGGSREQFDFVQTLGLSNIGYIFALVMAGMFASDPRPRYLRGAIVLLWLGTILCGLRVFLAQDGIAAVVASAGIALFWTVVLEASARQATQVEGRRVEQ